MNKHKFNGYISKRTKQVTRLRLINNVIALEPKNAFSSLLRIISLPYQWTWKYLPLMLCCVELNRFGMSNINNNYMVGVIIGPTRSQIKDQRQG